MAWRGAASTTNSAVASTATAWMPSGSCPTSRRCPTTTPSCSRPISTPIRCSAPRSTRRPPGASCAGCARSHGRPRRRLRGQPGRRRGSRRRRRLLHLDPRGGRRRAVAEELEVAAAYYDIGTAGEMHHNPVEERAVRRPRPPRRSRRIRPAGGRGPCRARARAGEASGRARRSAGAVRGSHPIRQLERHDGLRDAPGRRGAGRRGGRPARPPHAGAAPARAHRPRTRWPIRPAAWPACSTTRSRWPPRRSTPMRPPARPTGSSGPSASWTGSGPTTGTRKAAASSTPPAARGDRAGAAAGPGQAGAGRADAVAQRRRGDRAGPPA